MFQNGEQDTPGLTAEMRDGTDRLRFPKTLRMRRKGEASFTLDVVRCFSQLRLSKFSQAQGMCGKYGLSALTRAIVDARHFDEAFAPYFFPLVEELTLILEGLVDAIDASDAAEYSGTVLQFLTARAPFVAAQNTQVISSLVDGGASEFNTSAAQKRKNAPVKGSEKPLKKPRKASKSDEE